MRTRSPHRSCTSEDAGPSRCRGQRPSGRGQVRVVPRRAASSASIRAAAGEGGASGAASAARAARRGDAAAAGAAGASGERSGAPPARVRLSGPALRECAGTDTVSRLAELAGPGGENAPCLTASDCQPGLGCVGDQNAGLCQKYCCQDANDCEPGSYCAERPMRDATINALPKGSVEQQHVAADSGLRSRRKLRFERALSVHEGQRSAPVEAGTACLVVRSDGTTTCAVPGTGKVGQACPCAWGHVCSAATNAMPQALLHPGRSRAAATASVRPRRSCRTGGACAWAPRPAAVERSSLRAAG